MRGKILKYIIPVLVIVLFTVGFFCIKERMTSIDVSVDEIEFIEVEASEQAAFYTETSKQQVSDYLNGLDDLEIYHKGDPILGTPTYWITASIRWWDNSASRRWDYHHRGWGEGAMVTIRTMFC